MDKSRFIHPFEKMSHDLKDVNQMVYQNEVIVNQNETF